MNPQVLKDIKTLSTIQPEHIRKYDRMDVVIKFMQAKKEHPDYNENQLCALIGVSDSYLKRVMKDLDIKIEMNNRMTFSYNIFYDIFTGKNQMTF